jgi:hypothetical protein
MKKPFIRVTKWLGDIPVEAGCAVCPDVKFQVRSASHRPSREEYQKALQREFDYHVKTVHLKAASEIAGSGTADKPN